MKSIKICYRLKDGAQMPVEMASSITSVISEVAKRYNVDICLNKDLGEGNFNIFIEGDDNNFYNVYNAKDSVINRCEVLQDPNVKFITFA